MLIRCTLVLLMWLLAPSGFSQQTEVQFVSDPDYAILKMDGDTLGEANDFRLFMGFNERKDITEHEVIVCSPGFDDFKQTFKISMPAYQIVNVRLERSLPEVEPSIEFLIELKEVVSGLAYSTEVGASTKWKYRYDDAIGLGSRVDRIDQSLIKMGLIPYSKADSLLDGNYEVPSKADVQISGRVDGFSLRKGTKADDFSPYSARYTSSISIMWTFYDTRNNEVIYEEPVASHYEYRTSLLMDELSNAVMENFFTMFITRDELMTTLKRFDPTEVPDIEQDSSEVMSDSTGMDLDHSDSLAPIKASRPQLKTSKTEETLDPILYSQRILLKRPTIELNPTSKSIQKRTSKALVLIDGETVGSGIVVSEDGYIVTNHRYVIGMDSVAVTFSNGIQLGAAVVVKSERYDLALIKVQASGLTALAFEQNTDQVVEDAEVYIISRATTRGDATITNSSVSDKLLDQQVRLIEFEGSIDAEQDGAPLLNTNGEVIGILNYLKSSNGVNGYGLATDARYLKNVLGLTYE